MSDTHDVVVVGLGAAGGAAAACLAERGYGVLGLDTHEPPHALGSSHGETRMIREAYYQGSFYVRMVQTAYRRWEELGRAAGRPLLRITGGLMIGTPESAVFSGCLASAREHGLAHEVLTGEEVRERFPAFRLPGSAGAVLEPRAGMLALDDCLRSSLDRARVAGAELAFGEKVLDWSAAGGRVRLRTSAGEREGRRMVLAAGSWTGGLLPDLSLPLEVERTVQYWFEPVRPQVANCFHPEACPVWVWEHGPRDTWYGFPRVGRGIKVGMHVEAGRRADPGRLDRTVGEAETAAMRGVLERFMPDAAGRVAGASVCTYANTPDEHFILDRHPEHGEVTIFAGGSGHGFKFAPVLGELLADLVEGAEPEFDLAPFRIGRLQVG